MQAAHASGEKAVLAATIHMFLFVIYASIAVAIGSVAYWQYDYTAAVSVCLGGVFTIGCGLLHVAFAPRRARLAKRDSQRIDNELQALKDSQELVRQEAEELRTTLVEDARARDEKLTRELQDLAVMIARFVETSGRRAAQQAGSAAPPAQRPRSDAALLEAVREAIEDNRVEMHVQPVVTLPQRRTVFYEGYTRLRDATGQVILPGEFMRVAEASGVVAEIDNLLLLRCVQTARRMLKAERRTSLFCNISPTSLADESFFPEFIAFLRDNKDLAGSIMFELAREAFDRLPMAAERNMGRLFDMGFRFSLDRCDGVDLDLRRLERSGVRYVKVAGCQLVQQVLREGARPVTGLAREFEASDVVSLFARYGVDLIADRVEDEATVLELLDLDIAYAQGNLFGTPRPVRDAEPEGGEDIVRMRRAG
jgi:cyclic-di-GMP phosphodiesterase, flagellum assembly factor TipF